MNERSFNGLFVAEGSSDAPLGELVESLFLARSVNIHLTRPDYSLLGERVAKDLTARLKAGTTLMAGDPDVVVFHRDVDNTDHAKRRAEMEEALTAAESNGVLVPVIPLRMTEAWLLLDEQAIRTAAGNPNGHVRLNLPTVREVERLADPKRVLRDAIMAAADVTGRRRERLAARFSSSRRQLLERLDPSGPVTELRSWQSLIADVDAAVSCLVDGPF
jgi:hypothetical protein